jgi:hypothetical protein
MNSLHCKYFYQLYQSISWISGQKLFCPSSLLSLSIFFFDFVYQLYQPISWISSKKKKKNPVYPSFLLSLSISFSQISLNLRNSIPHTFFLHTSSTERNKKRIYYLVNFLSKFLSIFSFSNTKPNDDFFYQSRFLLTVSVSNKLL